jgi:hypothetical protein
VEPALHHGAVRAPPAAERQVPRLQIPCGAHRVHGAEWQAALRDQHELAACRGALAGQPGRRRALVAAAAWFGHRWYLVLRPHGVTAFAIDPGTTLERALAVLQYAHERGDETLQRKAFERVAAELGIERADELTRTARELAWSQRTPEDDEVEEFAEQARGSQDGAT